MIETWQEPRELWSWYSGLSVSVDGIEENVCSEEHKTHNNYTLVPTAWRMAQLAVYR